MTATATSPLELLREHIGHETRPIEPRPGRSMAIKCVRCHVTIDLSAVFGLRPNSARSTSTSTPPERRDPRPDESCPAHIGEWRETCRCCAAETKALPDGQTRTSEVRTGTDPTQHPEWQARKQALAERAAARRRTERAPVSPPKRTVDPETEPAGGATP